MKNQREQLSPKKYTHHIKSGASFAWAFTATMLVASSIAQASDMQIYAVPTAGKKTIVMMLDTSGSMAYNDSGQTGSRLTRLKAGMNAFLDSNNSSLPAVRVGLGHYSVDGSGKAGKILVPAAPLGVVGSAQRSTLRTAVDGLTASGYTPTAAAYAEAAAYLMGTSTLSSSTVSIPMYIRYYPTISTKTYFYRRTGILILGILVNPRYYQCRADGAGVTSTSACTSTTEITNNYTINNITNMDDDGGSNPRYYYDYVNTPSTTLSYQSCTAYNASGCTAWSGASTTNPTTSAYIACTVSGASGGGCVYEDKTILGTNSYSGFNDSVSTSKKTDLLSYQSPLPAVADRVSCDGQGVYVLSDGAANGFDSTSIPSVMTAALDTNGVGFNCSGGLTDANDPDGNAGGWHCMGEFAKRLFNPTLNPAGVSIQTAFVGFGNDMNSLSSGFVRRACSLSSRTQADRRGHDACSPNQGTDAIASPGYGNGGFFTAQTSQGVTDSVIAFINNLGAAPLAPLTTGGISVPADALSPSGLQPYGYLRALEPNPQSTDLIWAGNLKRYKVLTSGTNAGAFGAADGSTLVYNTNGSFRTGTKDLWNSSAVYAGNSNPDGGIVGLGGAYSRLPMPISGQTQNLTVTPKLYGFTAATDALRKLYTDVGASNGATLAGTSNGASLLRIPEGPLPTTGVPAYVLGKFSTQTTLQDMPILAKQKLLNYLGYSVPLNSTATALPSTLTLSATPHSAMGGSIHSFPVQMTYSATLDSAGNLTSTRTDSVLYGTMEGGLHVVDSATGVEQMVFVPSEVLRNPVASKAIVKGESDNIAPTAGLDGSWVVDSLYTTERATSAGSTSLVKARRMNVYGGLRMGGESYYGLNLLDPTAPKFLFRIGRDQTNFSRMGQSWSKPVLANIRYNGSIKRVMIVGGGYDQCYENPQFSLNSTVSSTDFPDTTCNSKPAAQGNAVYIIDATTGARLWWASNSVSGVGTANANMTHSIVSRISAIDGDGDGLIDNLYFGDLGGQVFRADLNNTAGTSTANFGKRVVRLANLATDTNGTALTGGKNPRFYEAPTVTIHDQGATTFMLIGLASGNRSTPLDVFPLVGRDGMKPTAALSDRLVNNVYGVIDRDFIKSDLITGNPTLSTENVNMSTFQKDPQTLTGNIPSVFVGASPTKNGWYRSLSSNYLGTERADNSFRIKGGMKAFEEPVAITGNLIVPVYDPQGTGITPQNPCLPRVVGETDRQRYCLPFGACLNSDGTINSTDESSSGFKTTTTCPTGSTATECNSNVIGLGIVGITPAPIEDATGGACPDFTIAGNDRGTGRWQCIPTVNPTRWYERWKK